MTATFKLLFIPLFILFRFLPPYLNVILFIVCSLGSGFYLIRVARERVPVVAQAGLQIGLLFLSWIIFPFPVFFFNATVVLLYEQYIAFSGSAFFNRIHAPLIRQVILFFVLFLLAWSGHFLNTFRFSFIKYSVFSSLFGVLYLFLLQYEPKPRDLKIGRYRPYVLIFLGTLVLFAVRLSDFRPHIFTSNFLSGLVIVLFVLLLFYLLDMTVSRDLPRTFLLMYGIMILGGNKAFAVVCSALVLFYIISRAGSELTGASRNYFKKDLWSRKTFLLFFNTFLFILLYIFTPRKYASYYQVILIASLAFSFFRGFEELYRSTLRVHLANRRIMFFFTKNNSFAAGLLATNMAYLAGLFLVWLTSQMDPVFFIPVFLTVNMVQVSNHLLLERTGRGYILNEQADLIIMNYAVILGSLVIFQILSSKIHFFLR
jgi:hypothetical protein